MATDLYYIDVDQPSNAYQERYQYFYKCIFE